MSIREIVNKVDALAKLMFIREVNMYVDTSLRQITHSKKLDEALRESYSYWDGIEDVVQIVLDVLMLYALAILTLFVPHELALCFNTRSTPILGSRHFAVVLVDEKNENAFTVEVVTGYILFRNDLDYFDVNVMSEYTIVYTQLTRVRLLDRIFSDMQSNRAVARVSCTSEVFILSGEPKEVRERWTSNIGLLLIEDIFQKPVEKVVEKFNKLYNCDWNKLQLGAKLAEIITHRVYEQILSTRFNKDIPRTRLRN